MILAALSLLALPLARGRFMPLSPYPSPTIVMKSAPVSTMTLPEFPSPKPAVVTVPIIPKVTSF